MAKGTLEIAAGTDDDYIVNLATDDGTPVTSYAADDTPIAVVWSGSDTPILFSPTCTWIDPSQGTIRMSILGSDTANLPPGKYRLRVALETTSGRIVVGAEYFLVLIASPGGSPILPSYCSHQDMLDYAPWLDELQDVGDETGFARQRHKARLWLDRVIIRHNPTAGYWNDFATPLFGSSLGRDRRYNRNWGQTDPVLQGWLDADYLRVTEQVVEITAKYALYLVCNAQVGPTGDRTAWQRMASEFYDDAQRIVKAFTAELYQTPTSTLAMKIIPCGRVTLN